MRRKKLICALSLFTACSFAFAGLASAGPGPKDKDKGKGTETIKVQLKGLDEAPVVISGASGELVLEIDETAPAIAYDLTYDNLEGTVTQAHIHIGQRDVAGGIALWLCKTANVKPADPAIDALTPTCPGPNSGNVSGTLTAANMVGPVAQAVPANAAGFADVLTAIKKGKAYGNVHSTSAPGGEVRGQLH